MFLQVKQQVQEQFKKLVATGKLFQVGVDRDKIWDIYLNAFAPEHKQENTCNSCKSFLRQYGGIVAIEDNKVLTLWDFEAADPEYTASIKALREYILSLPVSDIFLNPFAKCGTNENFDAARNLAWQHFYIELPRSFVNRDVAPALGRARDDKSVLMRSLNEIKDEAVDVVLELAAQGTLYRGTEFAPMVRQFKEIKDKYNKIPKALRNNFCWAAASDAGAVSRIRNSAIGTLLNSLSEGTDLETAVTAFERVVAPTNYKRPTSLVTPRMVEEAKKRLEELNMIGSLQRRLLSDRDLTVDNAIFVRRHSALEGGDVFAEIVKSTTTHPRSLGKVEEISITDFIDKVLPTAKAIKVLVENEHLNNLVSLVGPKDESTPTMFKWENNFSWSYTGEAADSIKERVKNAGGQVEGVLRVSLSWQNFDDLDLHVIEPNGYKIYFGNKGSFSPSGGKLDVDMNAGGGFTREPVENIIWPNTPKTEGRYKVIVNNYCKREAANTGFTVEVEFEGELFEFTHKQNGNSGHNYTVVEFEYTRKHGFKLLKAVESKGTKAYNSKEKWGIRTGQFHSVRAVTLSPNHWQHPVGNKHYFFILEGCKADEKIRPFYNEFLKPELDKDRKVFEVLGSKATVEPAEGELSGLGFSETVRNHMYVEVQGAFKRTLKVNF